MRSLLCGYRRAGTPRPASCSAPHDGEVGADGAGRALLAVWGAQQPGAVTPAPGCLCTALVELWTQMNAAPATADFQTNHLIAHAQSGLLQ